MAAAHCAHYLSVAETAAPHLTGPGQGMWLARLDADQANLRRAAEHAASRPDQAAQVLRFGVALWRYWATPSRNEEAAGLLIPVLRRPEAAADPALFAEALVVASELTLFTDIRTSLQLAEEAGAVAGRLGDDRLLALSRATLSSTYFFAGEPEAQARALGAESAERARQLGDDVLLGRCLLACVMWGGGRAVEAEAFACTERSGDLRFNQYLHSNAGDIALQMGDIPRARAHFEAAIRDGEALGTPECATILNLGMVQRAEQDLDGARSTFQEALRIGRRAGDTWAMAGVILGLAFLDADLGDWYRAAMLHGVAQALVNKTGLPWEPFSARLRQESLDQARQALGGQQLQRAYARGMALSFHQAIDLALGGVLPAT